LSQGGRRVEIDKKNSTAAWAREGFVGIEEPETFTNF
jgi:hypothetical protein